MIYFLTFLICALAWEVWFTYGLVDGQPVHVRRNAALNDLIPQNIDWLLNSLADAGKTVHLQTQWPWLIMTPLFYWLARQMKFRFHRFTTR